MPVKKDQVGQKISFPGFNYAPATEQGVVLLFGMVCYSLKFAIETVRQGFPDAIVIDYRDDPDRGFRKRVEFEFRSSKFHKQHHPIDGADIIVCWKHDWESCPKEIEVIELSKEIHAFEGGTGQVREEEPPKTVPEPKKKPDYAKSWEARVKWASQHSRDLALHLIDRLKAELPNTVQRPSFKWYAFYTQVPMTDKNRCAVVMMGKNVVRLAFRINPDTFKPDSLSTEVKGWFFPQGTERRVPVTTKNFEDVVKIARSAYEGLVSVEPKREPEKQVLRLVRADLISDTAARISLENLGTNYVLLNRYAIGSLGQHIFAPSKLIEPGKLGDITILADPGSKFEKGKYYDIRVWSERDKFIFPVEF